MIWFQIGLLIAGLLIALWAHRSARNVSRDSTIQQMLAVLMERKMLPNDSDQRQEKRRMAEIENRLTYLECDIRDRIARLELLMRERLNGT